MTTTKTYDFAAIGVGPFNLGLACLTEPIADLDGIFLDKRDSFNWHPGMLLESTTLQIPFMADLVTLADPTNPYSFLNYIKEQGRIYSFYIRENFLLLRNEYNQYCQWVIEKLSNIVFNTDVQQITYDEQGKCYKVQTLCTQTGEFKTFNARKLVLGTGTVPYIPSCCSDLMGKAIHSASYLTHKKKLQSKKSITILGSGQSAAEIFYDLLQEIDIHGYELNWVTRSPRFFPLEYSKLTLEMTSPDYVDYFHGLPAGHRDKLVKDQQNLYKGINIDLIGDIYDLLYTKRLTHDIKVGLRTNSELKRASFEESTGSFELEIHQHEINKYYRHNTEGLVLATGYTYRTPTFIEGIRDRINWDAKGRYDVHRDYSIDKHNNEIYVQNAELHTHGFVTPDLGMACYRNSHIIKSLTGKDHYPIEQRIAFQQFGVGEEEELRIAEPELANQP
ncbi:lysine N(6)-hydroxylase/L-ornithine N(5)-oxygenase family protein [Fulvivirga sp. 29W222]|uniref:Lysine N(6)-hydroxylase/L-ornithine N(5)-oxygenase family protein n=1 Tax=Fulvivirga marina TaxID=2494733 RepID=A0A937KF48_9BACT|nr:lysine N(6)-hydroxylase/L-ornithine N(5)-oxygenase family protein [Fulvivirga marina]MBL6447828.1 lysine N(6)-hydroxylase/L-ornithine N(5)-oxygenase family protein [Fulvivirga marina]QHG11727.1 putative monooxygenase [Fulvivirga marina]